MDLKNKGQISLDAIFAALAVILLMTLVQESWMTNSQSLGPAQSAFIARTVAVGVANVINDGYVVSYNGAGGRFASRIGLPESNETYEVTVRNQYVKATSNGVSYNTTLIPNVFNFAAGRTCYSPSGSNQIANSYGLPGYFLGVSHNETNSVCRWFTAVQVMDCDDADEAGTCAALAEPRICCEYLGKCRDHC